MPKTKLFRMTQAGKIQRGHSTSVSNVLLRKLYLSSSKIRSVFHLFGSGFTDIDVGDAQPLRRYGRPLTPPEHEATRSFIDDGLKDGLIEPSESP